MALPAALAWIFNSNAIAAQAIRFVGSALITAALNKPENGPRINDKRLQVSQYGSAMPRVYGLRVRIAGNVFDKTDAIETKHRRGGFGKRSSFSLLGGERFFGLGRQTYYTYHVSLAVALAEGPLPYNALKRIYANGRLIFDAEADGATPVDETWGQTWVSIPHGGQGAFDFGTIGIPGGDSYSPEGKVSFYRGSTDQPPDALLQAMHPMDPPIAYRGTAYVVIEGLQLADWGNSIPNLEFVLEPGVQTVGAIASELASFADVDLYASHITETCRGYVVSDDGVTGWGAIEPLASVYSFDLIQRRASFEAVRRGTYLRAVIPIGDLAAVPTSGTPDDTKTTTTENPTTWPDEVTVTASDPERDYQQNTQRAFRNAGVSRQKLALDVSLVLTADEQRQLAQQSLDVALAQARASNFSLSEKWRWLQAGDYVGVEIGGNIEPLLIRSMTRSPNTVIRVETVLDDPLAYISNLAGDVGEWVGQEVQLQGDTIAQFIDGPILATADDGSGFYMGLQGTGNAWRGADVYRTEDSGVDPVYEFVAGTIIPSALAECDTILPTNLFDVWDRTSTLTITIYGDEAPVTCSEDDVLIRGQNLAWVGAEDGHDGEYINFTTVTPGVGPKQFILSNFVRGRKGTEYAVGLHGAGERFVLLANDTYGRLDFGPGDWNIERRYKAPTVGQDLEAVDVETFTNTGEGKRPLSPVHLRGVRNATNNDILIQWTRRTRYEVPQIGGGAVPLGEAVEAYEVDIMSGATVLRTLTSAVPEVNYTAAMQTADGLTPGALKDIVVFQMSDVRGRGHGAVGRV